jgi:gliding motility-associated-like protein
MRQKCKILLMIPLTVGVMAVCPASLRGQMLWQFQPSGVASYLEDIDFVNEEVGFAVGDGGIILGTTNGGIEWQPQLSGVTENLTGVQFASENNGWAVGYGGLILKTTNGGATWSSQSMGSGVLFKDVFFLDALKGWACGEDISSGYGVVYRTTDGGTNWSLSSGSTIPDPIYSIDFIGASFGFCVTANDGFYTSDGGTVWWNMSALPSTELLYAINMVNSNNGWVTGANGTIYKTTTGGTSWVPQPNPSSYALLGIDAIDVNTAFVVGYGGSVLRTTNGGDTWTQESAGFTNVLAAVSAIDSSTVWVSGESGAIYNGALPHTDLEVIDYLSPVTVCHGQEFEVVVRVANTGNIPATDAAFTVFDGITPVISYAWSGNLGPYGENEVVSLGTHQVDAATILTVKIAGDSAAHGNEWYQPVSLYDNINMGTNGPLIACPGDVINLFAYGGVSYYWHNATPDSTAQVQSLYASTSQNYYVDIVQANCVFTDSVVVTVNSDDCATNAFSPNGDGVNEMFFIDGITSANNTVIFFNRWGDAIRTIQGYDNINVMWNGFDSSGQRVNQGSYYYVVTSPDGQSFAGQVQVVN